jgi:hypothetical protein
MILHEAEKKCASHPSFLKPMILCHVVVAQQQRLLHWKCNSSSGIAHLANNQDTYKKNQ